MKIHGLNIIITATLLLGSVADAFADGRPKLRELNEKKAEVAAKGVVPLQKKDKWGYADAEGKFIIRPHFENVLPMSAKQVGFVSYVNDFENVVWTPININGFYLTHLEFDQVVKDFDENGLAIVKKNGKFGVISHTGKMLVDCSFSSYLDRNPVYLFRNPAQSGWVAVVKDMSESGGTTYSFSSDEPIIAEAVGGYGVISPKTYDIVADFTYDNVEEIVDDSVYILQNADKKTLYAADCLSKEYEDIYLGSGNSYLIAKEGGNYGVLSFQNKILLKPQQKEEPVLKQDKYVCFSEGADLVYVQPNSRLSSSQYDDYLYGESLGRLYAYLLDTSLPLNHKKYVKTVLDKIYGTKDFELLKDFPPAVEYASSRRLLILQSDSQPAKSLDIETGIMRDVGDIAVDVYPAGNGEPAYIVARRADKYGILDVRSGREVLPFEYDNIVSLGGGFVSLYQREAETSRELCYLYNVSDEEMVTPYPCEEIYRPFNDQDVITVKQGRYDNIYDITSEKWIMPEGYQLWEFVRLPKSLCDSVSCTGYVARSSVTDSKGAFFALPDGKQLTEYKFNNHDRRLIGGKYYQVHEGEGRTYGVYDIAAGRYVLERNMADSLFEYNGDELLMTDGIYNVTKRKYLFRCNMESYQVSGDFVLLCNPDMKWVYSLKANRKLSFDFEIEDITLLDDGYAIITTPTDYGIYDFNRNIWQVPVDRALINDLYYGHRALGGDVAFLPGYGVVNYKTGTKITRQCAWADWVDKVGDYIVYGGGFEGESRGVYSLKDHRVIMEHGGCYEMEVISSQLEDCLDDDYILFSSYGDSAGGGRTEYYTPTSWLPWDDTNGGYGLYNINRNEWSFPNAKRLEYIGEGFLVVESDDRSGIYDLVTGKWASYQDSQFRAWAASDVVYHRFQDKTYLYNSSTRMIVPANNLTIEKLEQLKKVARVSSRYEPRYDGKVWKLYDKNQKKYVQYDFDMIKPMHRFAENY